MIPQGKPGISLFKVFGIQVYLHWSWFVVAIWQIQERRGNYQNVAWMVWEYLGLFGMVLLHEFGHALACRQVGGRSEQILLWPFGGVAYVQPPERPGAWLWSIAAGPLVNVALVPIMFGINLLARSNQTLGDSVDAMNFFGTLIYINLGLLIFNLVPVYPLDGGQILRSLLWFVVGPVKSLLIASVIGMIGGACLAVYAVTTGSMWMILICVFLLSQSWRGFQAARAWQRSISEKDYIDI